MKDSSPGERMSSDQSLDKPLDVAGYPDPMMLSFQLERVGANWLDICLRVVDERKGLVKNLPYEVLKAP